MSYNDKNPEDTYSNFTNLANDCNTQKSARSNGGINELTNDSLSK